MVVDGGGDVDGGYDDKRRGTTIRQTQKGTPAN